MWEKIRDYCLDVSKYFVTAVFVTSFLDDFDAEMHWMIYVLSLGLGAILFGLALFFDKKAKKEQKEKRNRYRKINNNKRRKE